MHPLTLFRQAALAQEKHARGRNHAGAAHQDHSPRPAGVGHLGWGLAVGAIYSRSVYCKTLLDLANTHNNSLYLDPPPTLY